MLLRPLDRHVDLQQEPQGEYRDKSVPVDDDGRVAKWKGWISRALSDVTAMLSALGASSTRLKRTRLRDQTRWLLPLNEFDPNDYAGAMECVTNAR